ncbi:MAG: serine/threonine protein kinase psk1 [Peltula sp. TS41687]|nr:MAG: serine/threonine protein kinase psk1 [Peltula sp. TS41687]
MLFSFDSEPELSPKDVQSMDVQDLSDPLSEFTSFLELGIETIEQDSQRHGADVVISEDTTSTRFNKNGFMDESHGIPMKSRSKSNSPPIKPRTSTPPIPVPYAETRGHARVGPSIDDHHEAFPGTPPQLVRPIAQRKRTGTSTRPVTPKPFSPILCADEGFDRSSTTGPAKWIPPRLKELPSGSASPLMRPSSACSQGGITAMRLQLESLNLNRGVEQSCMSRSQSQLGTQTPNGSVDGKLSEGDKSPPMTTYEVELEHDFVSSDVNVKSVYGALEGGLAREHSLTQKMCASDFEPLRCLGKGTYGTVLLVRHIASGRLYAQKQFRKASLTVHKKLVEQTKTERVILESVNRHPFVVKLYYAFQDHEKLYLILEYAQGGELFHHLAMERMFTEATASFYMAEMVLALEHLHHTVGVVYRDLKPENCLLDAEGHLLLTDFGLSKVAVADDGDDCCRSILGTVQYMAPEVVQGKSYGTAVDWWSLGALGFDLLTGAPPFQANNHAKTQEKIVKQKLSLPYFLSPDAKDLLTRLLRKDPNKRLGGSGGGGGAKTRRDLQTIKNHRFFRKIDWKALERRELLPPIQPLITDPAMAENFAVEFTDLAVSPVTSRFGPMVGLDASDPFGGFSFVASSSLLECGNWNRYE